MADQFDQAAAFFEQLQDTITGALERVDGSRFAEDRWEFHGKGGGRSRVMIEGELLEKGGVNFSNVAGLFPEDFAATMPGSGTAFRATGISLVLHPWNPHVPTVHANFRCIQRGSALWFGGGADLTPYYPRVEDCQHFHRTWRDVCRRHSEVADHARFKQWCDEYFFIKHRNEPRGVGGIFFDYLSEKTDDAWKFIQDAGAAFVTSYLPIVTRRMNEPYTKKQRDFQLMRRGRYVEFNLVYDRGTIFGLKTGGRIESILMSLPLHARWLYDESVPPGSEEARLFEFLKPRDWAGDDTPIL